MKNELYSLSIRSKVAKLIKDVFYFVLLASFVAIFYRLLFWVSYNTFTDNSQLPWSFLYNSNYELTVAQLKSSLIYAPIFETVVFIYLLFQITKWTKNSIVFIVTSSLLFGLYHFISGGWYIVISTAITGSVLAYSYVYFRLTLKKRYALLLTTLIHSLFNLIFLHL
jgi:membrane protease YdiL (CAAX protease family)